MVTHLCLLALAIDSFLWYTWGLIKLDTAFIVWIIIALQGLNNERKD